MPSAALGEHGHLFLRGVPEFEVIFGNEVAVVHKPLNGRVGTVGGYVVHGDACSGVAVDERRDSAERVLRGKHAVGAVVGGGEGVHRTRMTMPETQHLQVAHVLTRHYVAQVVHEVYVVLKVAPLMCALRPWWYVFNHNARSAVKHITNENTARFDGMLVYGLGQYGVEGALSENHVRLVFHNQMPLGELKRLASISPVMTSSSAVSHLMAQVRVCTAVVV